MLNVLIVEDDSMARRLLEIYINESENYRVAHSVESASMAEFYCITNKIDVILMDVCTALDATGLDAAEKIKENFQQFSRQRPNFPLGGSAFDRYRKIAQRRS